MQAVVCECEEIYSDAAGARRCGSLIQLTDVFADPLHPWPGSFFCRHQTKTLAPNQKLTKYVVWGLRPKKVDVYVFGLGLAPNKSTHEPKGQDGTGGSPFLLDHPGTRPFEPPATLAGMLSPTL